MEYTKNDMVRVTIEDIGSEGEGIGKIDGFTLFVKDAVVGDEVEARILKVKKNYAYARLEKVLKPSPFRVEPKCAYHRQCGGCQIQALSYEKQLEFKQSKVRNNLLRIGGFAPELLDKCMEPIVGMDEPFYYRNKAQYPVGTDKTDRPVTGFYAGRTHSIIANTECYLGVPQNKEILEIILKYMEDYHVSAYDEESGKGLVRHVLIRTGFTSGEIMVCLVLNGRAGIDNAVKRGKNVPGSKGTPRGKDALGDKEALCGKEASGDKAQGKGVVAAKTETFLPAQEVLLERLAAVSGMTSISVSINTEKTNVIMGKEIHTLWGEETISDVIHVRDMSKGGYPLTGQELSFKISPLSFYQVNPVQTEKLYSLALEYAGLTGQETVWDLYCGIGTISLFLADKAKQVYGVEIVPQAIEDAKENAKRNGITNAEFFVGKAEEVLPEYYERLSKGAAGEKATAQEYGEGAMHIERVGTTKTAETDKNGRIAGASGVVGSMADMLHPDVIVVDPPRKGCDQACLSTMLKMKPKRIVYVSCDSATMARDVKLLCEGGYELKKIRPVDQFGHTVHVETVVLLSQRKADDYIEVEFELDELDATSAETKATYREIQQYVMKQTGLMVSNLYIAQVKEKCGLEKRKNYNLPRSEESRQPKCPPEKEKAIMDALEHFGMV